MSTEPGPARVGFMVTEAIPVGLASVDKVLTQLWRHEDTGPGPAAGVLTRACMSNLVVVCRGSEQASLVNREVDEIVSRHPCRVLLLVADPLGAGKADRVQAWVSAHCHLSGGSRQVCSEVVTISAGGQEVRKFPSAVRSLLVGDLPTSLWWATNDPPPLSGEVFRELNPMADQVLYASLEWPDPIGGTIATADWLAHSLPGDPVVIDLSWRALRPWRQLISQSLDPTAVPGALDDLDLVEIEHGPHALPQGLLLAGWLASALGWTPKEHSTVKSRAMYCRFQNTRGEVGVVVRRLDEGEPSVRRVKVGWRSGGKASALTFAPAGPGHLGATAEGFDAETRALAFPALSRASLVAAELQHFEPDQIFRNALRVSRGLAQSL